jgi:transposase
VSKKELYAEYERVKTENERMKAENEYLRKMIFGAQTERHTADVDASQLNLFGTEEVEAEDLKETENISYERKKKKHAGRNKLPEHLPVEIITIEPQEDTTDLKKIGEEITESLKYTPASLVLVRTIRPKYVKKDKEGILIAPMPNRAIHKCIAESSLLSHIIINKFVDHQPFYRQIQGFKRDYDWELSSSTVNDWFVACCTLMEPIYNQMVDRIQQSDYIQVDESPIKVLESEKGKQTHQGYQWVYHSPADQTIVFNYRKGRGMYGPKEFLQEYKGYLQCDGYSVYDKLGKKAGIQLVGCLVHARRYFHQALDNDANKANYALDVFKKIYNQNREWKELETEEITQKRKEYLLPILKSLKEWCAEQGITTPPKSPIGKAMTYYLNQYEKLIQVVNDGKLELDNNLIENKIRPLALGRKNYLFAGNHKAGQRIAMMYTFFATCKVKNVNPKRWFENTLDVLADPDFKDYKSLLP